MDKFYRNAIETASLPLKDRVSETHKKYFGKITVTKTFWAKKYLVYDIKITEELFRNDLLKARIIKELRSIFEFFLEFYSIKREDIVLVAALGNEKICADSIGCAVCDKIVVTSHLYDDDFVKTRYGNLAAIKCGVSGNTGIESFDILTSIARETKPKIIFAIDALASNSVTRLSNTIQISDRGIEPGAGVGNAKRILNYDSLGCPVIAVGVPLVMYASKILAEFLPENATVDDKNINGLVVTAKEIDFLVSDFSAVIAEGINQAVHRLQ